MKSISTNSRALLNHEQRYHFDQMDESLRLHYVCDYMCEDPEMALEAITQSDQPEVAIEVISDMLRSIPDIINLLPPTHRTRIQGFKNHLGQLFSDYLCDAIQENVLGPEGAFELYEEELAYMNTEYERSRLPGMVS